MFSFCKDYVAEEAKVAPLLDKLTASSFSKHSHSTVIDVTEPKCKRKKREAHISKTPEDAMGTLVSKNMTILNQKRTTEAVYTVCNLCDLNFSTEVELEEHLYSLLHHRALDTEKGKNFVHECNICQVKCTGLPAYVRHLKTEEHWLKSDARRKGIERNPKLIRVYGLAKYKHTFACRPQKRTCLIQSPGAASATSTPLHTKTPPTFHQSGLSQLTAPRLHRGPSSSHVPTDPQKVRPTAAKLLHAPQGSISRLGVHGAWSERTRCPAPRLGRDAYGRAGPALDHCSDRREDSRWRNEINYRSVSEAESHKLSDSGSKPDGTWFTPNCANGATLNRDGFGPRASTNQPSRCTTNFKHLTDTLNLEDLNPVNSKKKSAGTTDGVNPVSALNFQTPMRYDSIFSKASDSAGSTTRYTDASFGTRIEESLKAATFANPFLSHLKNGGKLPGLFQVATNPTIITTDAKVAEEEQRSRASPENVRENIRKKFQAIIAETKQPVSRRRAFSADGRALNHKLSFKPSGANQRLKSDNAEQPRIVTFDKASSSGIESQSSLVESRLCDSELTGDPQAFNSSDNMETIKVNLPWSFQVVGSQGDDAGTNESVGEVSGGIVGQETTKSPEKATDAFPGSEKTGDLLDSTADVGTIKRRGRSVTSQLKIRSTLSKLAKQKRREQELNNQKSPRSSENDQSPSTAPSSDQLNTIEADNAKMPKKKPAPQPNLLKARRTRIATQQRTSSTSENESEKTGKQQTRVANLLLKLNSKLSNSSERVEQPAKRKLSGPRFGFGLASQDPEILYTSFDESDLDNLAETILKAEESVEDSDARNSETANIASREEQVKSDPSSSGARASQEDSALDQPASSQPDDSLSQRLLRMSEREELLHKDADDTKKKIQEAGVAVIRVNQIMEQLLHKKSALEVELTQSRRKEGEIVKELEKIRLDRLALLRGNVVTSSLSSDSHHPTDPPSFHSSNCTHSTPTPKSTPNLSATPVENPSPADHTTYHSFNSSSRPDQPIRTSQGHVTQTSLSDSVQQGAMKSEKSHVTRSSASIEPFPVAANSAYFDPETKRARVAAVEPSVDVIMQKYLKDARSEGEVTSSTHVRSGKPEKSKRSNIASDFHVSSTTNSQDGETCEDVKPIVRGRADVAIQEKERKLTESKTRPKAKKSEISKDARLQQLDKEQRNVSDATWSWVTAHSETSSTSDDTLPSSSHTPMLSEALTRFTSVDEVHSAGVLCLDIIARRLLVSCSKDATVRVGDITSGKSIGVYKLHHAPVAAYTVKNGRYDRRTSIFKVQIYVVHAHELAEKSVFSHSSIYRIDIPITVNKCDVTAGSKFNSVKIFDCPRQVLCIHYTSFGYLYLGTRDGRVLVFDCKKSQLLETLDCHSPHAICCMTSGMDGARKVLCCGSSDCRVSVRDATDGLLLQIFTGHTKSINWLQLKGNLLYSASSDRSVLVHNIRSGEVVFRFRGMHGGSVKALVVDDDAIITSCMDKCVRALQTEPCRTSGPPKPIASLPLAMCLHHVTCLKHDDHVSLPIACVGCLDGKVQFVPLTRLIKKTEPPPEVLVTSASNVRSATHDQSNECVILDDSDDVEMLDGLECLWSGCCATGFTSAMSLSTHIRIFHAPDDYPECLDSCCLWDNCTHYFSTEIDSSKDVRQHMQQHITQIISSKNK